jgi:hypothetical protein
LYPIMISFSGEMRSNITGAKWTLTAKRVGSSNF